MSVYLSIILWILAIPLALSFESRVRFCRNYVPLLISIFIVGSIFLFWDIVAIQRGDWAFNDSYILGFRLLGIPLEEILFFIAVPYSCLFIYEVICYFSKEKYFDIDPHLAWGMAVVFLLGAHVSRERPYTSTNLLFSSLVIVAAVLMIPRLFQSRRYWIYLGISSVMFLIFNYLLTSLPIVLYNERAISGLRFFSIPYEDFIYNFSLLTLYLAVYLSVQDILAERRRFFAKEFRTAVPREPDG